MFREVKCVIKHEYLPKEHEKMEFELNEEELESTTEQDQKRKNYKIQFREDQFERQGSQKGIVHLPSIQNFLYLLLMMIPEL